MRTQRLQAYEPQSWKALEALKGREELLNVAECCRTGGNSKIEEMLPLHPPKEKRREREEGG